jgi:hypothetical protein
MFSGDFGDACKAASLPHQYYQYCIQAILQFSTSGCEPDMSFFLENPQNPVHSSRTGKSRFLTNFTNCRQKSIPPDG